MIIDIQPIPAFPNSGTQLKVYDGRVELGNTANFQYTVLDASGVAVSAPARNALSVEQYDGWVGDDVYVCECVAANLGLIPVTGQA